MAIRSYNFPSSEVKEVDLSSASVTDSGSIVLAVGYANKGQIFSPTKIYSVNAFLEMFGNPVTDAEFYLYTTVNNVIADGGTPIVIRLPYYNVASKNYNGIALSIPASGIAIETAENITAIDGSVASAGMKKFLTKASAKGFTKIYPITTLNVSVTNEQMAKIVSSSDFSDVTNLSSANFYIVDKNKSICDDADSHGGLFIVVFDILRAMVVQRLLDDNDPTLTGTALYSDLDLIKSVRPLGFTNNSSNYLSKWSMLLNGSVMVSDDNLNRIYSEDSLGKQIAGLFPNIDANIANTTINVDPDYSNYIGIAVIKMVEADSLATKNTPVIVESFIGCIAPKRNKITGISEYIVDVVNNGSSYISIYANKLNQTEVVQAAANVLPIKGGFDAMLISSYANSDVMMNSFVYGSDDKIIKGTTIGADLVKALDKVDSVDDVQIDTVADSGLSSIAQFTDRPTGEHYQPDIDIDSSNGEITSGTQISTWLSIASRLEKFCSGDRKDCFALIDAPRNASIKGSIRILNDYDYLKTFAGNVEPGYSMISSALNSSYAAVYANWAKVYNTFASKDVWVPPSCFVSAACCRCDLQYNPWNSPAYLERGVISGVTEISLYPGKNEESFLYPKNINYIKYFSADGFVIWGQKTTQKKEGAFSRINVRRSMLRIERYLYNVGRQFIGKGNSVYNRRLYIDIVEPYLSSIKSKEGIYDYMLVCDDTNNTPEVIDANEFRSTCLIKPTREADFVIATVVVTNTGANFDEVISSGNF